MATEALVKRCKELISLARSGNTKDAYAGYKELYSSPEFATYPPDERRTALKLMVNAKVPPNRPAPEVVDVHRVAAGVVQNMVAESNEPADYELLGICYVFMGEDKKAAEAFRTGLTLEREKNPQSDLCGSLMKWVAAV
jgi:hypothetical protein